MAEERPKKQRKKLRKIKFDKRFIFASLFLVLSVVSIVYSSKYIFSTDIAGWDVPLGIFIGEDGSMNAKFYQNNIASHSSDVVYGTWEWEVRYYGSGSASVIFMGLDPEFYSYNLCSQGYKIQFEINKTFAIQRLDDIGVIVTLNGSYFVPEAGELYKVKVVRNLNNNFSVYLNDELRLTAQDSTYTTSEYFQLDWYNVHSLNWVTVTDAAGDASWYDHFSGFPASSSNNFFTKVSLYLPYIALVLVIGFYLLRLFFSEGNWTRFLVPLMIALLIGVGYGFLTRYIRDHIPDFGPDDPDPTSYTPTTGNGTDTPPTFPTIPTNTTNTNTTAPINPSNGFTGIPKNIVSIVLLGISGVFILIAVIFVGIDFFRRRDDEFHEKTLDKDKRWLPTATSSDHRKRVIRAYHKSSYKLIDHGAKSDRSMTPGEFETSVKDRLPISDKPIGDLTDLYEEARFSEHEITSEDSEKAENLNEKISQELTPQSDDKSTKDSKNKVDKTGDKENG